MTRVFPDFNELVASLAKRGVTVKACGNYSPRDGRMRYNAVVTLDSFRLPMGWPRFEFTVYGREPNELADDILSTLPLVEPLIAASERMQESRVAEMVEPNDDPKTAKEQPIKVADNDPISRVRHILKTHGNSAVSISTLIHSGVLTADEVRVAGGLPALAA
jgi:hypothetical protein